MRGGPGGEGSATRPDGRPADFFLALFGVFLGFFFGVSFGVVFFSLLDGSKTVSEPNTAPTWALFWDHLGPSFGNIWVLFWHLNLRPFSKRFLIDF